MKFAPSLSMQHLSARIFYPTAKRSPRPWSWGVSWLPHYNYAKGLGAFFFFRRPLSLINVLARVVLQAFVLVLGWLQRLWMIPGAPLAPALDVGGRPAVIFSHGLGGFRSMYSVPCAELASQGYVVLAVEHADGSSSAARVAGAKDWLYYAGLGGDAGQVDKTRTRVAEMQLALDVLTAMAQGSRLPGRMTLSHGLQASRFLCGSVDLGCVAAAGHSYGGATVAMLAAEDARFKAAIAFDPWWYALPPESAALEAWKTTCPILIMGSYSWNVPNRDGIKVCGERQQERVLQAARHGGGALLFVVRGTSHNTFADPLTLFSGQAGWLLNRLGLSAELDPVQGMGLVNTAALCFLADHLPLGAGTRAAQTWSRAGAWSLLAAHAQGEALKPSKGPLSWLFPGKGLLVTLSDEFLRRAVTSPKAAPKASEAGKDGDVLTGGEVAATVLPSEGAEQGPPAPGSRVNGHHHPAAAVCKVTPTVTQKQADALKELLGEEHIYLAEVYT
uniref:1-alkyl-2-acetylglycerophosphocholine esterase n=2 Tax=Auxenochlorella protothecoides TaxID=3075 RepID=A0A1D2A011_AUXPR